MLMLLVSWLFFFFCNGIKHKKRWGCSIEAKKGGSVAHSSRAGLENLRNQIEKKKKIVRGKTKKIKGKILFHYFFFFFFEKNLRAWG